MSKSEILAELPSLSEADRAEILERLWVLAETVGPTEREKALLDEAQARYDKSPDLDESWAEVEARLRTRG